MKLVEGNFFEREIDDEEVPWVKTQRDKLELNDEEVIWGKT